MKAGLVAAVALGVAAGCTKSELVVEDPVEVETVIEPGTTVDGIVLSVGMAEKEQEVKTSLSGPSSGKYQTLWSTGDRISINGTLSDALASGGTREAEFSVSGSLIAPFKVLYPGTSSSNVVTVPSEQTYVEGTFPIGSAPAYGVATQSGSRYSVKLTSFCGILRFALNGTATLDRIVLNALGGEKLSGNFTLTTDSNGFTGAFSGGSSSTLTMDLDDLQLTSSDTYVYIPIPAQTYASGLEALIYQEDGAFMRLKFWGSGSALAGDKVIEWQSKTFAAGRTENLLSINDLSAEAGGEPTAEAPGITVATYNVMRFADENRPAAATSASSTGALARPANAIVKSCSEMQAALGRAIYNTDADVIGFQEIGDLMNTSGQAYSIQDMAVAQGATSYTWKLNFPASESGNYHYCNGFAYRASVLTLNESGKVWLRTNNNNYSSSSASGSGDPNRTVVWAKFTHILSGKVFYFFVAQLPTFGQDGGSGTSNTNMAGGINAFASSKGGSYPQILVGDMNSSPTHDNSAGYTVLKSYWTDAYEVAYAAHQDAGDLNGWFYKNYPGTQSGTGENYHYSILQYTGGGKGNHPERRVDHIMTKGACTATSYKTIRNTYEFGSGEDVVNCAPSDHLPIVSYITLD